MILLAIKTLFTKFPPVTILRTASILTVTDFSKLIFFNVCAHGAPLEKNQMYFSLTLSKTADCQLSGTSEIFRILRMSSENELSEDANDFACFGAQNSAPYLIQ